MEMGIYEEVAQPNEQNLKERLITAGSCQLGPFSLIWTILMPRALALGSYYLLNASKRYLDIIIVPI
jgi:hypothetical protein